MLEWYMSLNWKLRLGLALAVLTIGVLNLLFSRRFYPWLLAIGAGMLLGSGRSDSERKGYHF